MKLPPDLFLHPDYNLVVWKPRGVLNEKAVNAVVRFLGYQEASSDKPFNRFSDTTFLRSVNLNFQFVFQVALYRRVTYAGPPTAKSAFLVDSRKAAHYFKFHAELADHSALQVRTFELRSAAARWLGVPAQFLEEA